MAITQAQIDKILGSQKLKPYDKNQSTITNTPRDIVSGTYADILKPFVSNPVAEFIGASDLQKALDSASYGQSMTTGGSMQTGGIRPEYLAVALGLTPMGKGKKVKTTFEEAFDVAQRNASLPVSQGGLGLPATNTAMDRAKAMGNVDVYHGSNSDITVPSYKYSGKGADQYGSAALYTATSPYNAGGYAKPFETFIENGKEVVINSGGNIMPLKVNPTNFLDADKIQELTPSQIKSIINKSTDEYALSNFGDVNYEGKEKVLKKAIDSYRGIGDGSVLSQFNMLNNDFFQGNPEAFNKAAQEATGYKGVIADIGSGEKFLMPFETSNIRSRFAAFDPFRRNESDILAGVGVGIPTTGLLTVDENKKKKTTKK